MEEKRSLTELAALLKASYREHAAIERLFYPDHPLPIEQCYVDLALIEDKIIHDQKKEDQSNTSEGLRDYHLRSYERIQHSQRKLTPEQLLTECRSIPKRIYIEGAAGAGKTTLSQFIAYQWSKDHPAWKDYDFLFRIRLRDLTPSTYPEQKIDFIEFLEKECFRLGFSDGLAEGEKKDLLRYLKSKTKKVLFILDGYDEFSLENHALKTLWKEIINSSYDFIITSRPGMQKANLRAQLNVAVLGFNDGQVEKYIQYFFDPQHNPDAQPQDIPQCLQTLRQNSNLWSLTHTPIQLELLLSLWREELKQTSDIRLTRSYSLMLKQLLKRYEQKRLKQEEGKETILSDISIEPLLESTGIDFEFLENSAFLGMEKNKLLIPYVDIEDAYHALTIKPKQKAEFFMRLKALGFMTRDSDGRQIEFIHLTFQEYFAARYIVRCFRAQQAPTSYVSFAEFIQRKKYHRRYEIVWWFVAGLLKGETNLLAKYFHLLQSAPHDLAALYQFSLQLNCLAECELNVSNEYKDPLFNQAGIWIHHLGLTSNDSPIKFNLPTVIMNQPQIISLLSNHVDRLRQGHKVTTRLRNLPDSILQSLVKLLSEDNGDIRDNAARTLSKQTILPEPIQQELIKLLNHENKMIQDNAAWAFPRQTALPETILQELVKLLNHEIRTINDNSKIILTNRTALPEPILQELVKLLNHENKNIQNNAKEVLSLQKALPESILQELIKLLSYKNVRWYAAEVVFDQITLPESILQELVKLLNHENENIQWYATIVLSQQTALPEPILQELVKLFSHENVQDFVAKVLSQQTAYPKPLLQQLGKLLCHENKRVKLNAAWALSKQTALPELILQELIKLLSDKDKNIQDFVAKILSKQTVLTDSILQELVKLLSHENVQRYTIVILSKLYKAILQFLKKLLGYEDVRWYAAEVLSKQTALPEPILQELIKLLNHENGSIQELAASTLSIQTTYPKPLLQQLSKLLCHKDKEVQRKAVWALSKQTALPAFILEELKKLLGCENVRWYAAKVLSQQTALPESILQELVKLFNYENGSILEFAAEALSKQTALPAFILQELVKLLSDKDKEVQRKAVWALSKQTALPAFILQELVKLLSDSRYSSLQQDAKRALCNQTTLPVSVLQRLIVLLNTEHDHLVKEVLSSQVQLSKTILIDLSQLKKKFDDLSYIKGISITNLCIHLNRYQWEASDKALLKLIILKCLDQKVALYFYNDRLYVDGESQGEFSSECQTQIIQTLKNLFTEITGIPASTVTELKTDSDLQIKEKSENTYDLTVSKELMMQEQIQKYDIFINEIKETKEAIEVLINHTALKARVTQELQVSSEKLETAKLNAMHENSKIRLAGQTTFDECMNNLNYLRTTLGKRENYPTDQLNRVKSYLEDIVNKVSPKIELYSYSITQMQEVQTQGLFFTQRFLNNTLKNLSPLGEDFKELLENIKTTMGSNRYSCFISYAKPINEINGPDRFIQSFLTTLRDHLLLAGFNPLLDFKCIEAGESLDAYMKQMLIGNHWLLIGTPSLPERLNQPANVTFETQVETLRKVNKLTNIYPMIPVLVVGNPAQSLPWHKQSHNYLDLTQSSYLAGLKQLLQALSRIPEKIYNDLWTSFEAKYPEHMQALSASLVTQIFQNVQQKEQQRQAQLENKQAGIYQTFFQPRTNTEEEFTSYSRPISGVHMWQPNNTNQLLNNNVAPNYSSSIENFHYPK